MGSTKPLLATVESRAIELKLNMKPTDTEFSLLASEQAADWFIDQFAKAGELTDELKQFFKNPRQVQPIFDLLDKDKKLQELFLQLNPQVASKFFRQLPLKTHHFRRAKMV